MDAGKLHALAETVTLLELVVGLAGKANDNIGGYSGLGNALANQRDGPLILRSIVATSHTGQHGVAAALKGEVEMRAEPVISPETEKSWGNLLWLEGGQPQSRYVGLRQDAIEQAFEVNAVVVVCANLGPGQYHFLVTFGSPVSNLTNYFIGRQAGLSTTYQRHNTVGAGSVAAILHLNKCAGP